MDGNHGVISQERLVMRPTPDQISDAAYHIWENRGHDHGQDRDDWLTAEQALLFALNYEVVAQYLLDGTVIHQIGSPGRRICRFCERGIPSGTHARLAVPESVGNQALFTFEECDECRALF